MMDISESGQLLSLLEGPRSYDIKHPSARLDASAAKSELMAATAYLNPCSRPNLAPKSFKPQLLNHIDRE